MMNTQGGDEMPQVLDIKSVFQQNLIDAGCSPDLIRQCTTLAQQEKGSELMHILSLHRKELLDTVHQNEKRIDCLDYLIYHLEKQKHSNT